ncbi:hypothetical protein HY969_00020 [Candidatus Kaiserbacteria bacterium]|nr:hypothetical protein [Candidatus Kaiserbacteria bacterium]
MDRRRARLEQAGPAFSVFFNKDASWSLRKSGREIFRSKDDQLGKYLHVAIVAQNRASKDRQQARAVFDPDSGTYKREPRANFADFLSDSLDCDGFVQLATGMTKISEYNWHAGFNMPSVTLFKDNEFQREERDDGLIKFIKSKIREGQMGVLDVKPTEEEEKDPHSEGSHTTLVIHGTDREIYVLQKKGNGKFEIAALKDALFAMTMDHGTMFAAKDMDAVAALIESSKTQSTQ